MDEYYGYFQSFVLLIGTIFVICRVAGEKYGYLKGRARQTYTNVSSVVLLVLPVLLVAPGMTIGLNLALAFLGSGMFMSYKVFVRQSVMDILLDLYLASSPQISIPSTEKDLQSEDSGYYKQPLGGKRREFYDFTGKGLLHKLYTRNA